MSNINFENIQSQIKQKIEDMNLKDKWARLKQTIEDLNLKDKWSKLKLKLDQLPIPKWQLVIITSVSVIVAIVSLVSKSSNNIAEYDQVDARRNESREMISDEYNVMLEEFAIKVERLAELIWDMKNSDNPFVYVKQVETLAAECEKLEKKLNAAPLNSRQKLYKNELKAKLEDYVRRLTWN